MGTVRIPRRGELGGRVFANRLIPKEITVERQDTIHAREIHHRDDPRTIQSSSNRPFSDGSERLVRKESHPGSRFRQVGEKRLASGGGRLRKQQTHLRPRFGVPEGLEEGILEILTRRFLTTLAVSTGTILIVEVQDRSLRESCRSSARRGMKAVSVHLGRTTFMGRHHKRITPQAAEARLRRGVIKSLARNHPLHVVIVGNETLERTAASHPKTSQRGRRAHELEETATRRVIELQFIGTLGKLTLQPSLEFRRTLKFAKTPPMDPGRFLLGWVLPLSLHSKFVQIVVRTPWKSMVTGRTVLRRMNPPCLLEVGSDQLAIPLFAFVSLL